MKLRTEECKKKLKEKKKKKGGGVLDNERYIVSCSFRQKKKNTVLKDWWSLVAS